MRSASHQGVKSPIPQGGHKQKRLSIRKMQLWVRLQEAREPWSCPPPGAALSQGPSCCELGPTPLDHLSCPTLTSATNPRETWGELTRHVRADDVQAHRDSPAGLLGEEEGGVGHSLRGGAFRFTPWHQARSQPTLGLGLASHPTTCSWEVCALEVCWGTVPGCYWNVSHNQRPSVRRA